MSKIYCKMSKIYLLYNQYVETIQQKTSEKDSAMEALAEMIPARDFAKFEERLNTAEDKMTEEAFQAGFGTAVRLIIESLGINFSGKRTQKGEK